MNTYAVLSPDTFGLSADSVSSLTTNTKRIPADTNFLTEIDSDKISHNTHI